MSEIKMARWKVVELNGKVKLTSDGIPFVVCDQCGGSMHEAYEDVKGKFKYCYECGAKMDTSDTAPGVYEE